MNLHEHLRAVGWEGGRPDIATVERALTHARVTFRRWCEADRPDGDWILEIDGAEVARGGAIGVLEANVWQWIRGNDLSAPE